VSKLLQRLKDASRSGVYRTADGAPLIEVARENGLPIARISFHGKGDKESLLDGISKALGFPDWFGGNWDALEDCLSDLSWRHASVHVLLFEAIALSDELGILIDVLASVAEQWAARGTPFFAVFADPAGTLPIAELFRPR
jgi:RNAse (barnase) inhibitor barstar